MAKRDEQEPVTLQDHIIARLERHVAIKGGGVLTDPLDGHEMTATEAIAYKMIERALSGDTKAAQFVMQLEQVQRLKDARKR